MAQVEIGLGPVLRDIDLAMETVNKAKALFRAASEAWRFV